MGGTGGGTSHPSPLFRHNVTEDVGDSYSGACFEAMNFAFTLTVNGTDYSVGLSNLIVALFLFLGPLYLFVMALRSFRAARRALFRTPTPLLRNNSSSKKLVRQALSGLLPVAYYLYLFVVSFWLALEGLNLIFVATARIFLSLGHLFFIGHAFLDNVVIFLLYFKKPGRKAIILSTLLAALLAAAKTVALVLLYGLEDDCESCPVFFPSPRAFYSDVVFAAAYVALLCVQFMTAILLRRAKRRVEAGQNFSIFDSYMVRFCRKIKARPALVPWLAYLFLCYGGAVLGSSIILFQNIDGGFCVMHGFIYVYVVPYCFLLWFILQRDADHLRRRKLRNQLIKERQAKDALLDGYGVQHVDVHEIENGNGNEDGEDEDEDEDELGYGKHKRHFRPGKSVDNNYNVEGGDEDIATDVSEYDTGSFRFPSARTNRHGHTLAPHFIVDEYEHEHGQGPIAAAAGGSAAADVSAAHSSNKNNKDREAAVALNRSLRQILRERTVPIRMVESRSVRLLRKIGVGGYGEVYQAEWQGIEVAVKRFVSDRPEKNFLKEIEVISRLDHPNVLAFIGAIVEPSYQCLITEYVPLGNVFQWLHAPKAVVTPRQQKKVALDTAKGMLYLHTRSPPIIHRDLKPMNLLITQDWTIKICDFGLSRPKLLTQAMSRTGTVQWVAPEILRELPYNEKCDVFSYAVVLWELYTRQIPWHKVGTFRVANDVAYQGQRLPLPHDCPRKLAALIEFCWDANPDVRPSFAEIVKTIEEMDESIWERREL